MRLDMGQGPVVGQKRDTAGAVLHQEVYDLRPWYHDYSRLGLQTVFDEPSTLRHRVGGGLRKLAQAATKGLRGGAVEKGEKLALRHLFSITPSPHLVNQRHKEQVIRVFVRKALGQLGDAPSCLDLFCADGYYSCLLAHSCAEAVITGVDLDPLEIKRAQTASRLLNLINGRFVVADVWEFVHQAQPYDLVLCTGGLYHLRDPRRLLEQLFPICAGFLLVQSVVTLETEDPGYFVSPAPGWKHGSRFTYAGLRGWLEEIGWEVVEEHRNELTGNTRLCDRGSGYFLCRTPNGNAADLAKEQPRRFRAQAGVDVTGSQAKGKL
jgi:hypothetical protein